MANQKIIISQDEIFHSEKDSSRLVFSEEMFSQATLADSWSPGEGSRSTFDFCHFRFWILCGATFSLAIFLGLLGLLGLLATLRPTESHSSRAAALQPIANPKEHPTIQAAQDANKSVVVIHTLFTENNWSWLWDETQHGLGSGTVIAQKGNAALILTNRHVVSDSQGKRATDIYVTSYDGTVSKAKVAALPKKVSVDLALVLTFQQPSLNAMWKIASYATLQQGEKVIAIGHPASFHFTITDGICSAKRDGIIQHSAFINPGNSGGPLLNMDCHLVGVNSFSIEDTQGLFFAFPAELVLEREGWSYFEEIRSLLDEIETDR